MREFAYHRAALFDERNGRTVNASLADYHIPTHADVPDIDVRSWTRPTRRRPSAPRASASWASWGWLRPSNAIYHATGKRVRDLPITPDKLM
jgi:xanthine dehydrogenase YagR molybdenum-binding subunit